MTIMTIPDATQLSGKLFLLGDTADRVADSLRKKGIVGLIGNSWCCPLAKYLRSEGHPSPSVRKHGWGTRMEGPQYPLPVACAAFVEAFDAGKYPDLISEEP